MRKDGCPDPLCKRYDRTIILAPDLLAEEIIEKPLIEIWENVPNKNNQELRYGEEGQLCLSGVSYRIVG